jgi:c-di-GMP phosphodiesterase
MPASNAESTLQAGDREVRVQVGRQPIFDRELNVRGYELLFRPCRGATGTFDGNQATTQVLLNTFMEIGLDRLVGKHLAFINFTRDLLVDDISASLPSAQVVLEVLEDITVDADLVAAVQRLSDQDFIIALDDFVYHPQWEPLIRLARIVKLDVMALSRPEVAEHVRRLRPYGLTLLAEKVETQEAFDDFLGMGFDLFQGYFFAKPKVVSTKPLANNRLALVQLLAGLNDPDADIDDIEKLVAQDVSLSFKLLRYLNSAFFGNPSRIESLRQAIVYFGLGTLKRWISLMVLASVDDKPDELLRTALCRARMCETLGRAAGYGNADGHFIVGLFSALEAILDKPMQDIVGKLPLSDEVANALVREEGALGSVLHCTLAYERCNWDEVSVDGIPESAIGTIYAEAVDWAFRASESFQ